MLIHTVLLEPASEPSMARIVEACEILSTLSLPGMSDFRHGPNRDFEQKSAPYSYGFSVLFTDRAALAAYADHPEHLRAGAMLVDSCRGGNDGIVVSDLDV